MANFSLLELGQNDELATVIKKSNMNFRNLGWALKQKIQQASDGSSSEWKQAIADLRDETEQEVSTLTQTIDTLADQLTEAEATMKKMIPPVGAILFQFSNPESMYPGTKWEKLGKHPLLAGNEGDTPICLEPMKSNGNSLLPDYMQDISDTMPWTYLYIRGYRRIK